MAEKTQEQEHQTDPGASASASSPQPAPGSAPTASGEPLRDVSEGRGGPREERGPREAAQAAGDGRRLSGREQSKALRWFLSDEPEAVETETRTLEINVGTADEPDRIEWVIQPVPYEIMRGIRRDATQSRAARRTGEVDEHRVNLAVVVAGTVDPDLGAVARELHQAGRGSPDPVDVLRERFRQKPGYIAQIAGSIMSLSGFDDEDVREVEAAKN